MIGNSVGKPFRFRRRELVPHVMNLRMGGAPPLVVRCVVDRADCSVVVNGIERASHNHRKDERDAVAGTGCESNLPQHERPVGATSQLETKEVVSSGLPFVADNRRLPSGRGIIFLRPGANPERGTRILARLDIDNGPADVAEGHSYFSSALEETQKSPLGVRKNECRKIGRWGMFGSL
jgi:hypothetical protein